ncbi:hypothetical protein DAEQUDRAFT_755306 [Daedalea quercina L-15889]|uniref:Transmembrane protein n=1 Tax=Daedalea quercina L-15889 TaxID=1314783 RepID=A0A165SJM8_9APHY|nr:hypothetical protein DAEQUDRAFT_755306 [Daedalea quercina L-15889]
MVARSASRPDMAQVATAPVIDPTARHPARAGTAPTPAVERNTLTALPGTRSQTLPAFPQFNPYAVNDSPLATPGSVTKLYPDNDTEPPTANSPPKRRSKIRRIAHRGCIAGLAFVERHWIVVSTLFIMIVVCTSIAVGWSLRLGSFRAAQVLDSFLVEDSLWVELDANLVSVDSDSQSITLDWFLYYYCPDGSTPSTAECPDVDIYFDQNLLSGQSTSTSTANNEKPIPIFTINATDYQGYNASSHPDYRVSSPQFRTQVDMTNFYYGGRSAQAYPFDKYTCTLAFFAQSISDNSTVPLGIGTTNGIAVGFNAKLDTNTSGLADYDVSIKNLVVTRGQVIRMYALLIVIAIWMITITFIMACIVSVFFGKGVRGDVLVLPVATLFAFTQLRGTMPGAPSGFGADIDFVGILPCLALLTFSSVLTSAVFLFRNPEDDSPRWQKWRALAARKPAPTSPAATV